LERVLPVVYAAVVDLHEQRTASLTIRWGGRRLYDRVAQERV